MKLHRILKDFPGSQDGSVTEQFVKGTERGLSASLAAIAVKEGWAEPVDVEGRARAEAKTKAAVDARAKEEAEAKAKEEAEAKAKEEAEAQAKAEAEAKRRK